MLQPLVTEIRNRFEALESEVKAAKIGGDPQIGKQILARLDMLEQTTEDLKKLHEQQSDQIGKLWIEVFNALP